MRSFALSAHIYSHQCTAPVLIQKFQSLRSCFLIFCLIPIFTLKVTITYSTYVVCTNVYNNHWLFTCQLKNTLQLFGDVLDPGTGKQHTILESRLTQNLLTVPINDLGLIPEDLQSRSISLNESIITH